jgi:serine protease Do
MRIAASMVCLICSTVASTTNAGVTPEIQAAIRGNTFEVVMKKPEKDPVSYEKPLPLDLLPFIERNDAYRSVGTAFALGSNTYVTAAHVFGAGIDSQFGPPTLRRPDGTVFAVDRILKFSMDEDFVVFSLREDPAPTGLSVDRAPQLDQAVLAVGNALGEGIVIRDGLFTSETPEAQDGRWQWIRFSAAASPGNSGGPLCDADGKVVGIVIGKSPNENLNYSLPIARVLDGEPRKARFNTKSLATLPFMHGTLTSAYKDEFTLPMTWPAFAEAYQRVVERHFEDSRAQLLKTYADSLFPKGIGSENLLFEPSKNVLRPRLITQQADGTWVADVPAFHQFDLSADGSVAYVDIAGARLMSLVRPGAASDDGFYNDSKAFMDFALKALDLRRPVGADQVRVTSLGPARSDVLFTDRYGRKWQERVWAIPFMDAYLAGELLPTPDGYAAIISLTPSAVLAESKATLRLLAAQFDGSYHGTLAQWRAALGRRSLLPAALSQVKLDKSSDWMLQTPRFSSSVPPDVLALTDQSPLTLAMGFISDGPQTLWDIQGIVWHRDARKDAAVELWRRARPPANAKLELRNAFDNVSQRRSPYDSLLIRDTVETFSISSVVDVPAGKTGTIDPDLEYALTVRMVGGPTAEDAKLTLTLVTGTTHVLERGHGEGVVLESKSKVDLDSVLDAYERQAVRTSSIDTGINDIRGRTMIEDLHQFIRAAKKESGAAQKSEDDRTAWLADLRSSLAKLQAYWNEVPALMRNRDMFAEFLSNNRLPSSTPHGAAVLSAESDLLAVLKNSRPGDDWRERALQLRASYVQERSALVKSQRSALALAQPMQLRASPCPAPATHTTGTAAPRLASDPERLQDYWPAASRRLGEEGTVIAAIHISTIGCVTGMSIVGFSGSDRLDAAVLKYLESASFTPAGTDGKPTENTVLMPIAFKLDQTSASAMSPGIARTVVKTPVSFDANHPLEFPVKDYPKESMRAHEGGVCHVRITVKADGSVQDPHLTLSTGHPRLDQACLKFFAGLAHASVFNPATEDGKAMDASVEVPLIFRITDPANVANVSPNAGTTETAPQVSLPRKVR